MDRLPWIVLMCILAGCAARVGSTVTPGMAQAEVARVAGQPFTEGRLSAGEPFWDYTLQPSGYYTFRVVFGPDGNVREVRNLMTMQNFLSLKPGMSQPDVERVLGQARMRQTYWQGTYSVSYRFMEATTFMLMTAEFTREGQLTTYFWEPDPAIYSTVSGSGIK
jgi:outer membrane protein assembly factor BamE (lipoprotein component of BamABCDE complex)